MFGPLTTLLAVIGLASLSAGGIAYALLYGRIQTENTAEKRLEFIQGKAKAAPSGRTADPTRRRKSVQDTLKELEDAQRAKAKQSKAPPLATRMTQAGLNWTKRTFWMVSVIVGLIFVAGSWSFGAPIYLAAALGVVGFFGVPRWYVNFRRKRRIRKFVDEFANAIDVIVRGVKAGLPLNDCIKIIANEAAEPVKSEFRQISETQALGLTLSDAVARLPDRVPTPEANFFAIVIAIQQRAGGNLAEALGNLSRVLRERKKMKGKISAMAMEAKASAYIIGALPGTVMVLVWLTSPSYIALLFTEPLGHLILVGSAIWMTTGILMMRKMIHFDF
ncbi:MAG TPA: type II secretion system F family protein [Bauldia sp.]|nr:type II secretion system F family protein [Bauldia sp.]